MDLRQSLIIEALGKPVEEGCVCEAPRVRAEQIAKQVFAMAKANGNPFLNINHKQWAKKWLASDEFVLTEINAASVAIPMAPKNPNKVFTNILASATSLPPIVVDLNKRGIGRAPGSGYIPPVIVVDGKHRATAININGRETIKAWVGVKALDQVSPSRVEIKASARKPQPQSRLDTTARLYAGMGGTPVPRQDTGDGGAKPSMPMPGVKATGPAMEPVTKGQSPEVMSGGPGSGRRPGGGSMKDKRIRYLKDQLKKSDSQILNPRRSQTDNDYLKREGLADTPTGKWFKKQLISNAGGGTGGTGGMGNMTSGPTPKIMGGGPGSGRRKELESLQRQAEDSAHQSSDPIERARWQRKAEEHQRAINRLQSDASDTKSVVDPSDESYPPEPSDQKQGMKYTMPQTSTRKCQNNDTKSESFDPSDSSSESQSPGSGVGPRQKPNRGASRSDLSNVLGCNEPMKMKAGKVGTIKTVAPPGFSEATMHKLKRKHGVENAFKIAWSQHNKG